MILTASHLLRELRWVPPAVIIIGSMTPFLNQWVIIRVLTLPLPSRVYQRLEERLYSNYQAVVGFFYEIWSGVEFCFYGDRIPDNPENTLYLSNHQCSVDWVLPEVLCVKQGGYGGRVQYILKDALRFLPLYGWYLGMRGGIFVKRNKTRDQESMIRGLKNFVEKDMPVWLVIFPEGTRYDMRESGSLKRAKSQEYATAAGLPPLQHILMPRTTGFNLALEQVRGHFQAVYDLTIYYEGYGCATAEGGRTRGPPPDLFGFYSGQCSKVHVHVRRVPIEDIPTTPEEQKAWMYDAFLKKDKLISSLLETGSFPAPRFTHTLPLSQCLLPLVFLALPVGVALSHRYGRRWMLATVMIFTAITLISGFKSRLRT